MSLGISTATLFFVSLRSANSVFTDGLPYCLNYAVYLQQLALMVMTDVPRPSNRAALWAALAGLGASLYLLATVDHASTVAEDAAILMRYSQHLAEGYGYVWNP